MFYTKPLDRTEVPEEPYNPYEQGTAHFAAGQMSGRIGAQLDHYAKKAKMPRRSFVKSAAGFAAAMLAVNKSAGMRLFDVQEVEAASPEAAVEHGLLIKSNKEFIVDAHTHVCWRRDGFVVGKNTTERGEKNCYFRR